jgi:hypothetical protein
MHPKSTAKGRSTSREEHQQRLGSLTTESGSMLPKPGINPPIGAAADKRNSTTSGNNHQQRPENQSRLENTTVQGSITRTQDEKP